MKLKSRRGVDATRSNSSRSGNNRLIEGNRKFRLVDCHSAGIIEAAPVISTGVAWSYIGASVLGQISSYLFLLAYRDSSTLALSKH